MNILITNIDLSLPSGTITYVFDLALGLKNKGFNVEVYTYKIGVIGRLIKGAGINVVTQLNKIENIPDVIHAHHNSLAVDALLKFKKTPIIFFVHDRYSLFDHPPIHKRIVKYAAVDFNCMERLTKDAKIAEKNTTVIYNWVNTAKFKLREKFADKPANALVYSNYATKKNYYTVIEQACKKADLKLDVIGKGLEGCISNPEEVLIQYDIIFAKAKSAIESLATGAAVILCDYRGLGEMVTQSNIEYFQKYNFGMKLLTKPFKVDLILNEIAKFNSKENRQNAITIRNLSSFENILEQLISLYSQTISDYSNGKEGQSENYYKMKLRALYFKNYFLLINSVFFKKTIKLLSRIKNLITI